MDRVKRNLLKIRICFFSLYSLVHKIETSFLIVLFLCPSVIDSFDCTSINSNYSVPNSNYFIWQIVSYNMVVQAGAQ